MAALKLPSKLSGRVSMPPSLRGRRTNARAFAKQHPI
jgi:hypothetical protein